ncbi:MAG: 50S ribosomal protein L21 [Ardenticatenia bacterium]|jgi:large subunit ribosomal protein L21|nr:MAG: 50S ribosomal protein L21 [Ardenticatenia bacterium]
MYAIIETGSKQYRVSEGDVIRVDLMPYPVGAQIEIEKVLLLAHDTGVKVGRPLVEGAKVVARVEALEKGEKLLVWKYRPKQRYRRRQGHRQVLSRLRIEKIVH